VIGPVIVAQDDDQVGCARIARARSGRLVDRHGDRSAAGIGGAAGDAERRSAPGNGTEHLTPCDIHRLRLSALWRV